MYNLKFESFEKLHWFHGLPFLLLMKYYLFIYLGKINCSYKNSSTKFKICEVFTVSGLECILEGQQIFINFNFEERIVKENKFFNIKNKNIKIF